MDKILEFIKTDNFLIIMSILTLLLIILYIISIVKFNKLNKKYNTFIKKMSKGNNFEETLKVFMSKVEEVSENNKEIMQYCRNLDNNIAKCIKKVGIVRYNAFKDTGSDLSFTLALLNEENTGVVLNGIYSREMSNIYAKPIEKGKSNYSISEQERQAINKAISSGVVDINE